ncbi:FUSC family protein [Acidisoma cellulosilytica]|uniref:FUSC family protein n=1 Tax=Acidisoma cellulosilyticum TaxID=2802395 RepID=A0A963YZZ1_9PROT|nr:FUSC family protein [Acidisoma cellulosilyticum]MCB8880312.1 FUSC family protein [Acidisoma cellulosilyticum]
MSDIQHTSLTYRLARKLESYSFAAAPEQIGLLEGARAALAVASLVALALLLGKPQLSWAAFGAFWACLADPGGRDGLRLRAMGVFALGGTVVAFCASAAADIGPVLAGMALLPLVFLPSLGGTYGPAISQAGSLVAVTAVVAVDFPSPPAGALTLAAIFLFGCLWAMGLSVFVWRIHRQAPARRAIASVFARLTDMATELLSGERQHRSGRAAWDAMNADHRRAIRTAIERARGLALGIESGSAFYAAQIDAADRIFAGLIAGGHHIADLGTSLAEGAERNLLSRLPLLLAEAHRQVARRDPASASLAAAADAVLRDCRAVDTAMARAIGAMAQALADLAELWRQGKVEAEILPASVRTGGLGLRRPVPMPVLHHAVRLALAVVLAYGLAIWLNLTFSYWATVAVVVVLQPLAATTWPRTLERVLGSIAGGVLAAAVLLLLPMKLALLLAVLLIAAAAIAFRFVNYTIFVVFLTALVVLITALLLPAESIPWARIVNNILGSLIAFAATLLLWPRQGPTPRAVLAAAIDANLGYAAAVVASTGISPALEVTRRTAGIASSAAETLQHRMSLEGQRRRAHLMEMQAVLHALRGVAGAATAHALALREADEADAATIRQQSLLLVQAFGATSTLPDKPLADAGSDDIAREIASVVQAVRVFLDPA